ncbi:hypothetical protein C8Q74DRAFT_1279382 [Fomes fomentarius]|nr:hypothetical protein C8Q74DRAFT_1279382 [Fomes fomentarius]
MLSDKVDNVIEPGDQGSYSRRAEKLDEGTIYKPEFFEHITSTITALDEDLHELSKDIHDHPELMFEEYHAHDVLTAFVEKHGFQVTRHYLLETAWVARYTHGKGGHTLGVNSEMDALPGIGHACGHNLIAISGVAVAIAVKAVLEKFDISGTVVLLGTPAEEGGAGKVILLEGGAYKGMDACLMCHPGPGPPSFASLGGSLAVEYITAEFHGETAHAGLSPWEGKNALDAAVLSYTNISLLRQQLKPTHRVHGTIDSSEDWAPNVIPDYSKMRWYVRAPTRVEVDAAVKRVKACFEAAALATDCEVKFLQVPSPIYELRQNKGLGDEFTDVFTKKCGQFDYGGSGGGSTDFGNVTHALPAIHPLYSIPAESSNHTREFADAAATEEAHQACLNISKALAATGMRLLTDEAFFERVQDTFEEDVRLRA